MRVIRTIYALLLRFFPIALAILGWYTARWLGMLAGIVLGGLGSVAIWAVVHYVALSSRLKRRMRDVRAMSTERLTELATDPTSRDMGFAMGELEKRGVEARPSFAAVCELLTAPDPNLRGQGMSLMFALYPEAFARIGKGASSADSPEVWRERLAAAEGEGSADCCI